jgi:MFS family permease
MWSPDELGSVVSLYSFGPLLGPAIGPIAGGFITQYSTWRWSFFALAIASGAVGIVGIFTLKETYGPRLLRLKAKRLRKERQDDRFHVGTRGLPPSLPKALFEGLVRPLKMAYTQPIIAALSLLLAYIWGVLYLLLSTFSQLWTVQYHQSISIGSINYISLAIGLYLGTHIGVVASNKVLIRFGIKRPWLMWLQIRYISITKTGTVGLDYLSFELL